MKEWPSRTLSHLAVQIRDARVVTGKDVYWHAFPLYNQRPLLLGILIYKATFQNLTLSSGASKAQPPLPLMPRCSQCILHQRVML